MTKINGVPQIFIRDDVGEMIHIEKMQLRKACDEFFRSRGMKSIAMKDVIKRIHFRRKPNESKQNAA